MKININCEAEMKRKVYRFRYIVLVLSSFLFFQKINAQNVEIHGKAKITTMDTVNSAKLLVVKQSDGTLAAREVASLNQNQPDTIRSLNTDFELARFLCNCNGNLPPFLVESTLNTGYSVSDLFNASVPVQNLVKGGASIQDLIVAGAPVSELLDAGVGVGEIYQAGGMVSDLLAAGVTVAEMLDAGIPSDDIYEGGGMVIDLLDEGVTPIEIYNAGAPLDSLYGKLYQQEGGYILHLNTSTGEGMVIGPGDFSAGIWGCEGLTITGADGITIGTGYQNTIDIDSDCGQIGNAAERCLNYSYNGHSDWYLPSKDELNLVWTNLVLNGIYVVSANSYWSSTENTASSAWAQNTGNGNQVPYPKGTALIIRPVRNF